jgi:WD40 repeat protein
MFTLSGKTIKVFDSRTLQLLGTIDEEHTVDQVGFSPDGKWLVTRTHATPVGHVAPPRITRVWDTQNFQAAASQQTGNENDAANETSKPATEALNSAQKALLSDSSSWPDVLKQQHPSADGRWIVKEEDFSPKVTLQESSTGREVNTLAHDDTVTDRAFSPDSRWLATASADRTVRIWALKAEDLIEQACARLPRNLSREEWTTYLGNEPYSPTCPGLPVPNE